LAPAAFVAAALVASSLSDSRSRAMKFFAPACVGFGAVADRARFGVGEVGVVNAGASPCAL
jgi:hypothetical protein